jgi:DNA polymerase-3 subunit epsilon
MLSDLKQQYCLNAVPHEFLRVLQKTPKAQIKSCVERAKHRLSL